MVELVPVTFWYTPPHTLAVTQIYTRLRGGLAIRAETIIQYTRDA